MLHWIQYVKGYVSIKVWGYSTERFLNLCGNHDILVWDIENHGDYYTMKVSVKGFFALKTLLRKTGTRAAVLKRYGLPFFVPKMKRRKIFVSGLLICLLFWILTGFYIWDIKIEGNYSLTEDVLMDYLETQGVHTSMPKKNLQIEELEMQLREEYDIITWASLRVDGTTLIIQIRENELPDNDYENLSEANGSEPGEDAGSGKDIVASKDGVIVYMITRKGVPQVTVGDTVEKGQILVSGAVPVYNDDNTIRKYQYYEADADIQGRTFLEYQDAVDLTYEEKEYMDIEKIEYSLKIGDYYLRFGSIENSYDAWEMNGYEKRLCIGENFYLPVTYGRRTAKPYRPLEKKYSKRELQRILSASFQRYCKDLDKKGVEIIENNVKIYTGSEKAEAKGRLTVLVPVGAPARSQLSEVPVIEEQEETGE